jgi:hypothetical protein
MARTIAGRDSQNVAHGIVELEDAEITGVRRVTTGDESWFFVTDHLIQPRHRPNLAFSK